MASSPSNVFSISVEPPGGGPVHQYHPGHYVAFEVTRNGVGTMPNKWSVAIHPGVVGVQMRYYWKDLEPTEGNYDLTTIAADLADAASRGLQMIALIIDKTFNSTVATPPYLDAYTSPTANGTILMRWKPYVVQRWTALMAALGAAFNSTASLEGVGVQESSLSLSDAVLDANGYTPESYRDALIAVLAAADAALPDRRVFWYMNFLVRHQSYLLEIAQNMVANGHGGVMMGGPDILPQSAPLNTHTYDFYDIMQGQMRLFCSMQNDSYAHPESGPPFLTMQEMFDWGVANLHINYCLWNWKPTATPATANNYADALPVIAANPTFGPP